MNGAFEKSAGVNKVTYDFDQIQASGELIIATLSGPDTYYEYQGQKMGLQYALALHFAQRNGLRVRVELAHDLGELIHLLKAEEADIVCYPLSDSCITLHQLQAAGVRSDTLHSWAVRPNVPQLAAVLDDWYGGGFIITVEKAERQKQQSRHEVRRKVRAPYLSKEKGIISVYDEYFINAARVVGWDWRLIAAQCYQESGFDPAAESWAGAKGLMQIMPGTAEYLSLPQHQIYEPRENVSAAARYLRELNNKFDDIISREERIKFVLASYNGGAGHVRDAMALTRKYGGDEKRWAEVRPYILKLSEPRYYRDPVVKCGYMIGSETYNYVESVWERWRAYGGTVSGKADLQSVLENGGTGRSKNKYTKGTRIYSPNDPEFNELNK